MSNSNSIEMQCGQFVLILAFVEDNWQIFPHYFRKDVEKNIHKLYHRQNEWCMDMWYTAISSIMVQLIVIAWFLNDEKCLVLVDNKTSVNQCRFWSNMCSPCVNPNHVSGSSTFLSLEYRQLSSLLLILFIINLSMDVLSIPIVQRLPCWSYERGSYFNPTLSVHVITIHAGIKVTLYQ